MFVERQIVSATVHAGLDQEQVPGAAASFGPAAPRNRIRHARIEVRQPVEALRPGARKVPSKPQVQGQLIGNFPGVPAIKTPIELLPGNWTRDIHSTRCLVAQGGANPLAKAQNEVGEIDPRARRTSALRFICRPEPAEGNKASSGVGLQIVVIGEFKLPARSEGMPPTDNGDSRGEVVLCVFVRNRTLSLAVSYQSVRNGEIGRQGGSLYGGDCAVVRRRKTLLRNVEPGILRCTEVAETAGADIHARLDCWTHCVIVVDRKGVGVIRLGAAVLADARAEWVARQIRQLPITVPAKDTAFIVNNIVYAGNVLVAIPAQPGGLYEVVEYRGVGRFRYQRIQQKLGSQIEQIRIRRDRDDVAGKRLANPRAGID